MKRGKAAGLDALSVEHLIYCHPVVVVLLCKMFNFFLLIRFVLLVLSFKFIVLTIVVAFEMSVCLSVCLSVCSLSVCSLSVCLSVYHLNSLLFIIKNLFYFILL